MEEQEVGCRSSLSALSILDWIGGVSNIISLPMKINYKLSSKNERLSEEAMRNQSSAVACSDFVNYWNTLEKFVGPQHEASRGEFDTRIESALRPEALSIGEIDFSIHQTLWRVAPLKAKVRNSSRVSEELS